MTDWPRFEPVKGPADTAYRQYNGGRPVAMVFRLIDWWRGGAGAAAVRAAPALDPKSGPIEVLERPPRRGPAVERSARDELVHAHARLTHQFPDEAFSRDFILGSARTRKLQAALLAALVAVTVALVALETVRNDLSSRQTAQRPGYTSIGALPRAPNRAQSANAMPGLSAGGCGKSAAWPPSCSDVRP